MRFFAFYISTINIVLLRYTVWIQPCPYTYTLLVVTLSCFLPIGFSTIPCVMILSVIAFTIGIYTNVILNTISPNTNVILCLVTPNTGTLSCTAGIPRAIHKTGNRFYRPTNTVTGPISDTLV